MDRENPANEIILEQATHHNLIRKGYCDQVRSLLAVDHPFASAIDLAKSIHIHSKVEAIENLPATEIRTWGATTERHTPGYVKYGFPNGIHLIFSTLDDFEEIRVPEIDRPAKPYVDHIGIDLREKNPATTDFRNSLEDLIEASGQVFQKQPGPVLGCYAKVDDKVWAYPADPAQQNTCPPVEFAFGPLALFDKTVGCTFRPIHPEQRHLLAAH